MVAIRRLVAAWTVCGGPARAQRGQAVLELAGGAMFLVLLVMGLLDGAPAVIRTAQLYQAVREGVAYGRLEPDNAANIKARVQQSVPALNLSTGSIVVTCYEDLTSTPKTCGPASSMIGDTITVSATYTYVPSTALFRALMGSSMSITRSASSEIY